MNTEPQIKINLEIRPRTEALLSGAMDTEVLVEAAGNAIAAVPSLVLDLIAQTIAKKVLGLACDELSADDMLTHTLTGTEVDVKVTISK